MPLPPPGIRADMLLEHGELGLDPPRLADVGGLGQPVLGADEVGPKPQSLPAGLTVRPRDIRSAASKAATG